MDEEDLEKLERDVMKAQQEKVVCYKQMKYMFILIQAPRLPNMITYLISRIITRRKFHFLPPALICKFFPMLMIA